MKYINGTRTVNREKNIAKFFGTVYNGLRICFGRFFVVVVA